jgi:hypothetical protein
MFADPHLLAASAPITRAQHFQDLVNSSSDQLAARLTAADL